MNDRDLQRLNELEEKTAYIMARQDQQETKLAQIAARLIYIEAKQNRILRELGMNPEAIDSIETALADARTINLTALTDSRLN